MAEEAERGINYLSSSPTRIAILAQVCNGATQPADLVDATDVSRTTVHRTLTDFVDRDWVRRVDGGYAATAVGMLALNAYRNAKTTFQTLEDVKPFLLHLETDVAGLEIEWFETVELSTAVESNPYQPLEWYADRLAAIDGDRLRRASPVVNRQFIDVHTLIVDRGITTEFVIGEAAYEIVTEWYPDELRAALSYSNYELYVTDETPSIGVTLLGDTVLLGAYDDDGQLVAVIESSDRRLRDWAVDQYDDWRTTAQRVSADAVPSSPTEGTNR